MSRTRTSRRGRRRRAAASPSPTRWPTCCARGAAEGRRPRRRAHRGDPGDEAHPRPDPPVPPDRRARRRRRRVVVDRRACGRVEIITTVRTADRTGVEMEALTAAAVGGLTVIDMVKGRDRSAAISEVVLLGEARRPFGSLDARVVTAHRAARSSPHRREPRPGSGTDTSGPIVGRRAACARPERRRPGRGRRTASRCPPPCVEAVEDRVDLVITTGGTGHTPDGPHTGDDPAGDRPGVPRPGRGDPRATESRTACRRRSCRAESPGSPARRSSSTPGLERWGAGRHRRAVAGAAARARPDPRR